MPYECAWQNGVYNVDGMDVGGIYAEQGRDEAFPCRKAFLENDMEKIVVHKGVGNFAGSSLQLR